MMPVIEEVKTTQKDSNAIDVELVSVKVVSKLANGTSESGKIRTINESLAKINLATYDDQKAMNIVNVLEPCLSKEIYETRKIAESIISNAE